MGVGSDKGSGVWRASRSESAVRSPSVLARARIGYIVIGIKKMIVTQDALTEWQLAMATAILAMLPPVLVVIVMQKLFVKGLVETEK